jgi:hypothetical protein
VVDRLVVPALRAPAAVLLLLAVLRLAVVPRLVVPLLRLAVPLLRLAVVLAPVRAEPVFLAAAAGLSGCVISFLPPSRANPGQGRRPLRPHTHSAPPGRASPVGDDDDRRQASQPGANSLRHQTNRRPPHAGADRRLRTRR